MIGDNRLELMLELNKNDLLVVEFFNILIPPIFSGYMLTFVCIMSLHTIESLPLEKTLLSIQQMAETAHKMGAIQNPTFCSIFYTRNAYQFLLSRGVVQESSKFQDQKIMKCFKIVDFTALRQLVKVLRNDFLWEENYRIIRKVFEERFLNAPSKKELLQRL